MKMIILQQLHFYGTNSLSSLAVSPQNYEIFDFNNIDSPVFVGWWGKVESSMLEQRKVNKYDKKSFYKDFPHPPLTSYLYF